nr:uncharacterized protein CTRU02_05180 [Colletotrichum truncatum]KAF6794348.1 hypothetical protein CTRU02_05180 [Colletotrichum truncatum]
MVVYLLQGCRSLQAEQRKLTREVEMCIYFSTAHSQQLDATNRCAASSRGLHGAPTYKAQGTGRLFLEGTWPCIRSPWPDRDCAAAKGHADPLSCCSSKIECMASPPPPRPSNNAVLELKKKLFGLNPRHRRVSDRFSFDGSVPPMCPLTCLKRTVA